MNRRLRRSSLVGSWTHTLVRPRLMKRFVALSVFVVMLCSGVCAAGSWIAPPDGSPAEMMQHLDRAHWIASGRSSSTRVVYIFTDPNCPFCHDLWKALRTNRAPEVQIRYLLVAVINADSRGKSAAILESDDPAHALEMHERKFDSGGIASKRGSSSATNETLGMNQALMQSLHIYGTPGLVYLDEHGAVKVFAGMPDPEQLRRIVGKH